MPAAADTHWAHAAALISAMRSVCPGDARDRPAWFAAEAYSRARCGDPDGWRAVSEDAYRAYLAATGGMNYRGEPLPPFEELPEPTRAAWEVSVRSVVVSDCLRCESSVVKICHDILEFWVNGDPRPGVVPAPPVP